MNKQELVASIAQKTGLTKKYAASALDAFVSTVSDSLKKKDTVRIIGFGTWTVRRRAARKGRNPRTKAPINIPARYTPVFKPSNHLKNMVNR